MKTADANLAEIEQLKNKPVTELLADMRKIQAALDAKRRDEEARRIEAQTRKNEITVMHVDALLALVPLHSTTACSDANLLYDYKGRCLRCVLLDAKQCKFLDVDFDVNVTIQYNGTAE